jgi:hypothetical protein
LDDQQASATRVDSRPLSSAIAGVGLVDATALAGRPERRLGVITETLDGTAESGSATSARIRRIAETSD